MMRKMGPFARCAVHLLDGGYSPIPVRFASKRPLLKSWDHLRSKPLSRETITELSAKYPALNLAVAGGYGGLVPIDIDTDDADIIAAATSALPEPNVAKRGQRGFVAFYRGTPGRIWGRKFKMPGAGKGKVIVEILTTGKTIIPPSIHADTGKPYLWTTKATLLNTRVTELVRITPSHITALARALRPWVPPQERYEPREDGYSATIWVRPAAAIRMGCGGR